MSTSVRKQAGIRLNRLSGIKPEFRDRILDQTEALPLRLGPGGYQITDQSFNGLISHLRQSRPHWFEDAPVIAKMPDDFSSGDTVTLASETWARIPPAERLRLTYKATITTSKDGETVKIVPNKRSS